MEAVFVVMFGCCAWVTVLYGEVMFIAYIAHYFMASTDGEAFSLVLDVHKELCMTSWCTSCLVRGWPCDPADQSQRWYMRGRAIVNSESGGCLESNGDGQVVSGVCDGGVSQEWEFGEESKSLWARNHTLGKMQWVQYSHNKKCMRFDGISHYDVELQPCVQNDAHFEFLKWTKWPYPCNRPSHSSSSALDTASFVVATEGEEFWLVLDVKEELCMTSQCRGCYALGRPCDSADQSQRWYMRGRAIVNSEFGGCLEPDEHNHVVSRECHGQRSQEWEFACSRGHLLGEMRWVGYLQNMKCMQFNGRENHVVFLDICENVAESKFLKLTELPYSRNKTKDVASSCLDPKCPECPMCSHSSHPKCPECPTCSKCPECPTCSKCPECPTCSKCPECPTCSKCPECPTCSKCPECPTCSKCPECPTCSKCPECPTCSKCPECPTCSNSSNPDCQQLVLLTLLICCGALGYWIWKGSKGDKPTGLNQLVRLDTMETTILQTDTGSDGSDSSSVGSWTHVTSGQPCCFLPDTYFEVVTDDGEIFKPAKMLFRGTRVIAANGTVITVLTPPEQHQVDAVIKLQVGSACLVVSPDHRILIPGNRTIQARELEVGSVVFLDGTEAELTSFEWNCVPTMVLKIAFQPDIPVAPFMRPPAILSLGSRNRPPTRRGHRARTPQGGDALTIPDTEPPWTP